MADLCMQYVTFSENLKTELPVYALLLKVLISNATDFNRSG